MSSFKVKVIVFLSTVFFFYKAVGQQRAKTEKGDLVILHDDGRWEYEKKPMILATPKEYNKPSKSKKFLKGDKDAYGIWYDDKKWILQDSLPTRDVTFAFSHLGGEGFALVIAERVELSRDKLKEIALKNAKEVAPDIKIVNEEIRKVNGYDVLMLQLKGTIEGVTFVYYSYYYTGKIGAVQFITYTSDNLFSEYRDDFEDLLNGLVILN